MRQSYSIKTIQSIVDQYGNFGAIQKSFLFTSGYENSNYFIKTKKGRFVVKIFEGVGVKPENILFELEVMDASYHAKIKSPHVVRTRENALATVWNDKYVTVMDYIDGENMNQREISDQIAYEIGQETGKMDTALSFYKDEKRTRQNYEWDLKNFPALKPKIEYLDATFDQGVIENIFNNFQAIKPTFDSLPKGVIHNDVALHNILVKNKTLKGLVDFSDLAFSPYIQNIAVPMAQMFFCYNWKPHQAALFIEGYKEYHPLSAEALSVLYDLICARYATIVVEFNYWNKKLFGEDAQCVQAVNDFYKFLVKFIEFGKTHFNQLFTI